MDLECKYCGKELKNSGNSLAQKSDGNRTCYSSPTEKHVAVSNPPYCVYCGRETRKAAGGLGVNGNISCPESPDGEHQLED
jgi:hypothetical protein